MSTYKHRQGNVLDFQVNEFEKNQKCGVQFFDRNSVSHNVSLNNCYYNTKSKTDTIENLS